MIKKMKNEILETVSKLDELELTQILKVKINEYIAFRDEKINDKIYPDANELILIKSKHDDEANKILKIFESILKEILFKMGKCDVTAAKAVQREMKKINEQQAIRDRLAQQERIKFEQDRVKFEQQQIKFEQDRQSMLDRISELESLIKLNK